MTLNLLTNGMYDEKTGLYTLDENCPIYADHQAKERFDTPFLASLFGLIN